MSTAADPAGDDLAGLVAIITGAGDEQGLGFAHARHLAARGARIVLNDLGGGTLGLPAQGIDAGTAERAAATLRAQGAEVLADNGDVADAATAERMVAMALEQWGRVDIVVNNAGIASAQFFPDVDPAEVQRHVGVTLQGCLNTARAAWPHLVASGQGRVVLTGSPACTATGEAFLVGGGGFARVVYAAGALESLHGDAAAVASAFDRAMASSEWTPLGSTRESTTYLGLPADA